MANKKLADQINQAAANFASKMMKGEVARAPIARSFEDFKWQVRRVPLRLHSSEWWKVSDKIKKLDWQWKKAEKPGKREDWLDCFQVILELAGAGVKYEREKAKKLKLDLTGWNQMEWEKGKRPALIKCGADVTTRKKFSALDTGRNLFKGSGVPQEYLDLLIFGRSAEKMPKLDKQKALSLCKQSKQSAAPQAADGSPAGSSTTWSPKKYLKGCEREFVQKMERRKGFPDWAIKNFRAFQKQAENATAFLDNSPEWDRVMVGIEMVDRYLKDTERLAGVDASDRSKHWKKCFWALMTLADNMDRYCRAKLKEPGDGEVDDDTKKKLAAVEAGELACRQLGVPASFILFLRKRRSPSPRAKSAVLGEKVASTLRAKSAEPELAGTPRTESLVPGVESAHALSFELAKLRGQYKKYIMTKLGNAQPVAGRKVMGGGS